MLPAAFAVPAAYGDLIAGILAIVTTSAIVNGTSWASKSVWLFNVWGAADLLLGFYEGLHARLQPEMLGAAFFLVTALVPPLLITHALIFRLLVRRHTAEERQQRQLEHLGLPTKQAR